MASQMLTYRLFKTQSMLLSATSMKSQPDADLQPVQNPEHAPVSNKHEEPARCWLTACSKSRAYSCQQHTEKASQMLTYILFNPRAWSCQQQAGRGSWLTDCSKPRACSCQQQAGKASEMLTYILFKTQRMLLSATSKETSQLLTYILLKIQSTLLSAIRREGQPDADLHPFQNPKHALVSIREWVQKS